MINQAYTSVTKEYHASGGILIIESIFSGDRPKADVIREIIVSLACFGDKNPLQPTHRNTAHCGSQSKEAENWEPT